MFSDYKHFRLSESDRYAATVNQSTVFVKAESTRVDFVLEEELVSISNPTVEIVRLSAFPQ